MNINKNIRRSSRIAIRQEKKELKKTFFELKLKKKAEAAAAKAEANAKKQK
jgi:hypothetical protein